MDQNKKLVSVIVPCFNQGKYIAETLNSIQNQSYKHWECIVVDDGSTDNTKEAVQIFLTDPRIKYYHQENTGVSAARNRGIDICTGEYVQFLDGDDKIASNKFSLQVDMLDANSDMDIVFGSSRYFYHGKTEVLMAVDRFGNNPTVDLTVKDEWQTEVLVLRNLCPICAPLHRKSVFKNQIRFLPIIFEDWLLHIQCSLEKKKFHYHPIPGTECFIRMTEASQMHQHKLAYDRAPDTFPKAVKQMLENYNSNIPYTVPLIVKESSASKLIKSMLPPIVLGIARRLRRSK